MRLIARHAGGARSGLRIGLRTGLFGLLTAAVIGCAGGTKSYEGESLSQRQQAAALNAQLGSDYFRQGNWEEAKVKLERALDQDPRNVEAHWVVGLLYDRLNEQDKALSHLQRAVSLDERKSETRNALATYLCRHGKYEQGEKHALTAAAEPLYKTPEVALLNAGTCARGRKDLETAEKHFRRALEIQPRFAPALFEMADLEFQSGQFMVARAFFERYLAAGQVTSQSLLLGYRIETALGNKSVAADYGRRLRSDFATSDEAKVLATLERSR